MPRFKFIAITSLLMGLTTTAFAENVPPQVAPFLVRGGVHDISVPCNDIENDLRSFYESDLDQTKLDHTFTYACLEEYKRYVFELIVEARTVGDVAELAAYAERHKEHDIDGSTLVLEKSLGEFLTMRFSPRKLASPDDINTYRPIGDRTYKNFYWTHRGYSDFRDSFADVFFTSPTDWKAAADWTAAIFGKPYAKRLLEEILPAVDWLYVLFDKTFIMADGDTYQFYREVFEFDCRETGACLTDGSVKIRHSGAPDDRLDTMLRLGKN